MPKKPKEFRCQYDGTPWTEEDIRDLKAALRDANSIEEVAEFLCRAGTVDDVRRKVEELGLIRKSRPKAAQVKGETPQLQTQTYAPPAPSELANS